MTQAKEAMLQALRGIVAAIEGGADVASSKVSRDAHGWYQVEVLLSRGAQLEPFSFNGIQAPPPAPIGVYEGDGHPRVRILSPNETPALNAACTGALYEPDPEGAEET